MRYLLISCCFLLVSCGSYPTKNNFIVDDTSHPTILNPYFSNPTLDYVYKAQISIKENNFGGILIIKKINQHEHRVVFTSEMGNKLFDFSYAKGEFKVNAILGDLDKKLLINLLKKDFKVLITEQPSELNSYKSADNKIFQARIYGKDHYYFFKENHLEKIVKTKKGKENTSYIFSDIHNDIAKNIQILHNKINLEIGLIKI